MKHGCSQHSCHPIKKYRNDYLLIVSSVIILSAYLIHLFSIQQLQDLPYIYDFTSSTYELVNIMWWGVLLGIVTISILSKVPREFVISVLGKGGNVTGIIRATIAGMMLDLCSHGILLVGMKLYERGASIGQVIAFLVASPWNSFSLTLVMIALMGIKWTLVFIITSAVIAILSGILFDLFVKSGALPKNPNSASLPENFQFFAEAKKGIKGTSYSPALFMEMFKRGIVESRMVMRWMLFGIVLASLIRSFMSADQLETYFGPTILGLISTVAIATIIEVCSEGSTPIAADLLNRAGAPGNSFAFLMTGISTDYTEIMSLKETTSSWKIPLFLPLITVPQVLTIAWILNLMY